MDTVNEIKSQYARILRQDDWIQFKHISEYYLKTAAFLKKSDIPSTDYLLLLRNSQKRLYIGIGCELIIKAFYLREGYCINKFIEGTPNVNRTPTYKLAELDENTIDHKDTYTLGNVIDNLSKIYDFDRTSLKTIRRGFQIAMTFRNKEGHVTFPKHEFIAENYRDIEAALKEFYKIVFEETLTYFIYMEANDKAAFEVR